MRSLRLDADLEEIVKRAASYEGLTVSEFLRRAAAERAERTLGEHESNREKLKDIIGSVRSGGPGVARDASRVFGDMLLEEHRGRSKR